MAPLGEGVSRRLSPPRSSRPIGALMPQHPTVIALGEILWDLLPAGKQMGGAPANFAFHAKQLGARAITASAVGDDALGRELLARLTTLGLETAYIHANPDRPTGVVEVSLDQNRVASYTIHENAAWDFLPTTPELLQLMSEADCVCFGTLAQRSEVSRKTILTALNQTRADCLRIFDINLRQRYYSREIIEQSLMRATVLKVNDQELPALGVLLKMSGDIPAGVMSRFGTKLIALTRGGAGAVLMSANGTRVEHPGYPAEPMADTIGAGDSFTAALAVGLLRQMPLKQINDVACQVASYVCTQAGATPVLPPEITARMHL